MIEVRSQLLWKKLRACLKSCTPGFGASAAELMQDGDSPKWAKERLKADLQQSMAKTSTARSTLSCFRSHLVHCNAHRRITLST